MGLGDDYGCTHLQHPADRPLRPLFQLCDQPAQDPALLDERIVIQLQFLSRLPLLPLQAGES